jgi:hypothetical protein
MGFDLREVYYDDIRFASSLRLALMGWNGVKPEAPVPETPEQRNLKAHGRLDNNSAKL